MKKIFFLFSILILFSCSTNNSANDNASQPISVLVNKIIIHKNNTPDVVFLFSYNGNKLITVTDQDGIKIKNIYNGDNIIKQEIYDVTNAINYTEDYTYSNNRIIQKKTTGVTSSFLQIINYTYNSDGSIISDFTLYSNPNITSTTTSHYMNGNLIDVGGNYYTYDLKNTPFKNITGKNNFINLLPYSHYNLNFGFSNNMLTYTNGTNTTYQYNSQDYPIVKSDGTETIEYLY